MRRRMSVQAPCVGSDMPIEQAFPSIDVRAVAAYQPRDIQVRQLSSTTWLANNDSHQPVAYLVFCDVLWWNGRLDSGRRHGHTVCLRAACCGGKGAM